MGEVIRIINQMESVNKYTAEGQRELKMVIVSAEEKIKHLEYDYRENWILSARVTLYCSVCRSDLEIYKILYVIDYIYAAMSTKKQMEAMKQIEKMEQEDMQQLKMRMIEVKNIIKRIETIYKYTPEGQEYLKKLIEKAEENMKHLEEDYKGKKIHSPRVTQYCTQRRSELNELKTQYENMSTEPYTTEQMKTKEENRCDETEEELQKYSKKIDDDSAALLLPERGPESSPDQVEVLDEGVALMSLK